MNRTRLWTTGCVLFLLCVLRAGAAFANPFEETIRILENRTAFHWGRDCFIWVVHYSEELVDPWVESEAGRVGMSESERSAYRNSFVSDLSMGTAEPVLVTVHSFGARPLNFAPFSDRIVLITQRGERVRPTRYDRIFDQPLSGVIQGLVFFPKQNNPDFAVAISGMGVYDERIFSFVNEVSHFDYAAVAFPAEDEPEIIIVELPPAPRTPPPPPPPPQPVQPVEHVPLPPAEPEPEEPEIVVFEPENDRDDIAYISREQTLRAFLDFWVRFDVETMYSMLADSSQRQFSMEAFEAELRNSQDFRTALRSGYRIDWLGADQARIVAARRILVIRTLVNRTLGLAREGSAWKIIW